MKKLTNYQKEFILEHFFKSMAFLGWKNIASELLDNGTCIVAGSICIWHGGIGNFIETEKAENSVGCLLYKFDLDVFLSSEWYKEIRDEFITGLLNEKEEIKSQLSELESEYKEICNL